MDALRYGLTDAHFSKGKSVRFTLISLPRLKLRSSIEFEILPWLRVFDCVCNNGGAVVNIVPDAHSRAAFEVKICRQSDDDAVLLVRSSFDESFVLLAIVKERGLGVSLILLVRIFRLERPADGKTSWLARFSKLQW